MEIEVVAENTPDKILTTLVEPNVGLRDYQVRDLGFKLGFDGDLVKKFVPLVRGLYNLYIEKDCSQVEINPLVVTQEGELFALDGKLNFDDNALYRNRTSQSCEIPRKRTSANARPTKSIWPMSGSTEASAAW